MKSSGKAFTGSIVMSMILIASIISLASAGSPVPPMSFWGSLTVDGSPASAGTNVVGYADGFDATIGSPHVTTTSGMYGAPLLEVECVNGELVTFRVNGELAHQSIDCNEGDVGVRLDLTVGESSGDCSPGETRDCGSSTGECEYGTETCSGEGEWGVCEGAIPSSAEVCDGLDNDCDGTADENFGDLGDACSVGVGECEAFGEMVCKGDHTGTECSATPGATSSEVCDGLDNDCDGSVDEGIAPRSCGATDVGECTFGVETCGSGSWIGCTAVMPSSEDCDSGNDEDCDGFTDCDDADCSADIACVVPDEYCIQIISLKVLNNDFNEDYYIMPGEMYNIEVVNYNSCEEPVETMQIIQIDKIGNTPVNIGTVKTTIAPYSTSTITIGFVLPGVGLGTQFDANAYNWNHWISQNPSTWEALSAPASVGFEAGMGSP